MTLEHTDIQLRIRAFERATQDAVPNSEESRAAQRFFKENYMGLTEGDHSHLLGVFPNISETERPMLQQAFREGLQALAEEIGTTAEATDTKALIASLPARMGHTVHKVGLECGMSAPR